MVFAAIGHRRTPVFPERENQASDIDHYGDNRGVSRLW
jgi:hypothetical protein